MRFLVPEGRPRSFGGARSARFVPFFPTPLSRSLPTRPDVFVERVTDFCERPIAPFSSSMDYVPHQSARVHAVLPPPRHPLRPPRIIQGQEGQRRCDTYVHCS